MPLLIIMLRSHYLCIRYTLLALHNWVRLMLVYLKNSRYIVTITLLYYSVNKGVRVMRPQLR